MDDELRNRLFDPQAAHGLVLARRPPSRSAVADVVSDVVWDDVVVLLRWAAAGTRGAPELEAGRWWRLASGCADLLRRLPGSQRRARGTVAGRSGTPTIPVRSGAGPDRGRRPVRLERLLRSPGSLPLAVLAAEIDALGAAAVSALAERGARPGGIPLTRRRLDTALVAAGAPWSSC